VIDQAKRVRKLDKSSWDEHECLRPSRGKTKEGSKICIYDKVMEGVVAATTESLNELDFKTIINANIFYNWFNIH